MPQKEASFHLAEANGRARKQQAESNAAAEEAAVDALMDKDGFVVSGITLHPLTVQTIWALQALGSAYINEAGAPKALDMQDIALGALAFADPHRVWSLARAGKKTELEEEAFEFAGQLDFATLEKVNAFINAQFASISTRNHDTPVVPEKKTPAKKPAAASATAPGSSA